MSAPSHPGKLPRKMTTAVAALLTAPTEAEAAAQAGIGEATLRRWKQRPEFRDELRAASQVVLDATVARMRAATTRALDTLTAALDESHAPTRVRAALGLLALATRVDTDELAAGWRYSKRHWGETDERSAPPSYRAP